MSPKSKNDIGTSEKKIEGIYDLVNTDGGRQHF